MKVKIISRNPDDYQRETKNDIYKMPRNFNLPADPFQAATEYTRALNATKLERVFAKPFIASLDGHLEAVHVLAKHPTRLSTVLTGARDGQVKVWNLPRRQCLTTIQTHNGPVNAISVDGMSGDSFVTVGQDCQLKLWRLPVMFEAGRDLSEPVHSVALDGVAHSVSHVANSSDFVTSGENVSVWKPHRESPLRMYDMGVSTIQVVRANPIEEAVLVGSCADRSIFVLDTRQRSPLTKVTMKLRPNAIAWHPLESFTFTVASEDYNLYTFDVRYLTQPKTVHEDHTAAVMDVDYSPTGREFVTGSYDRSIRIFPYDAGHSRMQQVLSVLWSLDGKFILSGSDEMNVRVWKARASEKIGPLRPREKAASEYADRLRDTYKEHPQIKRIARHRQVPKSILSARKEHRTIKESQKRKEANRRAHSSAGTVPFVPEIQKHMVREE